MSTSEDIIGHVNYCTCHKCFVPSPQWPPVIIPAKAASPQEERKA